jgi:hypothetical protein
MILLDDLLLGGFKFVLGKIRDAALAEMNHEEHLKEDLLALQMRLELGEIGEAEFAAEEKRLLAEIRVARDRAHGPQPAPGTMKVTGVEATVVGDEEPAARHRR